LYSTVIFALKLRMHDQYKQKWFANVSSAVKLNSYTLFKQVHQNESYVSSVVHIKFRTALVKFRVSSHNVLIETGRYDKVERNNIICTCCDQIVVENE
jgi:hypothetical protein